MSTTSTNVVEWVRPEDELITELGHQFEIARVALGKVGGIARQLRRQAAEAAAQHGAPRIVRVRANAAPVDPATGKPIRRGRGRPRGASNHLTLLATPDQIAKLRVQLAR